MLQMVGDRFLKTQSPLVEGFLLCGHVYTNMNWKSFIQHRLLWLLVDFV